MFGKSVLAAIGLALSLTVGASAAQGGGKGVTSILKCPVVCRLGLTEEQMTKVKELDTEYSAKIAEAVKDLKGAEKATKTKEIMAELRTKVVELLTDEQKTKHEAGMAILAEGKEKAEMEKALDEKVGPKATPAKAAPAKAPKAPKAPKGENGGGEGGGEGDQGGEM
jgi:hypothetical protein